MPLAGQTLLFLDVGDDAKKDVLQRSLMGLGAIKSTDRTLLFPPGLVPVEEIANAVESLDEGDCVTVVYEDEGQSMSMLIVPPKLTDGIAAG